jgi:hypothetical protein
MSLTDFELNLDWQQDPDNREKYQGQWVVLKSGKLLAYGTDYIDLYQNYGNEGIWIVKMS